MVDRETTFDMAALAALPVVEKVVTLTCVSNPVGGDLISNATWTGYRVRDILAGVGVHPDADMVLSKSIDGFTAGTPVEALTDGRDTGVAFPLQSTYTEWAQSDFARRAQPETCQSCHMPEITRPIAPSGADRTSHSHRFRACLKCRLLILRPRRSGCF